MENLTKCSYFDVPYNMQLIQCLDSINLSAFYRTLADCIKDKYSYWNCLNLSCEECIFHKNICKANLFFTAKEWVNFMFKDVGYIMKNYSVNEVLIKQMVKDKAAKE